MRQCIVTGGSGFIGQHLFRRLCEAGAKVTLVNDLFQDIDQSDKLASAGPYEVFHLAGRVGVQSSWQEPTGFIETNVCGTAHVLEFCRKSNSLLRFFSSPKSFESSFQKTKVESASHAANPYLFSKDLAEQACQFFAMQYDVEVLVVRLFNVYGPGQSARFLIPMLIEQLITRDKIVVENYESVRDYIYIDDVVDALMMLDGRTEVSGALNLGTGVGTSVIEIIEALKEIHPRTFETECKPGGKDEEIPVSIADITNTKRVLAWKPTTTLMDGLKKTYRHVCEEYCA
jgi:nucleoside-diphosphate-sugar epimerase